jgi:hypothetical protein
MNTIEALQPAVNQAQWCQRDSIGVLREGMKVVGDLVLARDVLRKGSPCHRIDFARFAILAAAAT